MRADHMMFHRIAIRPLQAVDLAFDILACGLGDLERLEPLPQVLHLGPFVPFAELLADRLHLLPQEHLALALAQLFLDLGLDVLLRVEHADLPLDVRSEEYTSELQSQSNLVCRLLLEKKKQTNNVCDNILY